MSRWIQSASELHSAKRLDDGNHSDQVSVERRQVAGGNPEFFVRPAAGNLDRVAFSEAVTELESSNKTDIAGPRVRRVPVSSDLPRVVECQNRVEDGLFRKSRWELLEPGASNETQFAKPDGTVKNHLPCLPMACASEAAQPNVKHRRSIFVGMDMHAETITAAQRRGEVCGLGIMANRAES